MSSQLTIDPVDHAQATELFSTYWDQDLSPEDNARLEEHLRSCVVCRREFQEFQRTVAAVTSLGKETAPRDFVQGVVKRLRRRSRGRFFSGRRALERMPYEMFSAVMLAILLAIYIIMQLGQPGHLTMP